MKRKLSWVIAVLAYIGVPILAWLALQRDAEAQHVAHAFGCGNVAMGIMIFSFILSGALSLVASVLGFASFRGLPSPRPQLRILELAVLAFPLLAGSACVALCFFGNA